jgi:hypothetical protein
MLREGGRAQRRRRSGGLGAGEHLDRFRLTRSVGWWHLTRARGCSLRTLDRPINWEREREQRDETTKVSLWGRKLATRTLAAPPTS